MKFSCEKAVLAQAINLAQRAVSAKSSIPALEGVLINVGNELTISGYNMNTGIRTMVDAEIGEPGELVLNARLFGDIVRRLPDDTVCFESDNQLLVHLSCGDASFDIPGLSAMDYPELPDVDNQYAFTVAQNTLRAMIGETLFAVSTNESRPIHTGSLFELEGDSLTLVSVDGFRLALRCEKVKEIEGGKFSFVAPGSALSEVEKICADSDDDVCVTLGQRHILFEIGNTELICRRLEGEFLDYRSAVPRTNPIKLVAETKNLIQSIDRVSVVINEKAKSPVRCVFGMDRVALSAKTAIGDASDVCPLSGSGNDLEIGFNNHYLMDALRYAPATTVQLELNTGISPCVIVPTDGEENFLYMVLPVRLKAQ